MEPRAKNMRLRDWLVTQVDSGQFAGLSWENEEKTMFRIPWKHAAKQDYKQSEDAALFKAWAVYKGKYREGRDRADPTMWKTRLRCALNKSTDFQEVAERSQLDLSEPYKVYSIQADVDPTRATEPPHMESEEMAQASHTTAHRLQLQVQGHTHHLDTVMTKLMLGWRWNSSFCLVCIFSPNLWLFFFVCPVDADFRLKVRLMYQGHPVTELVTSSPDGCFVLQGRVPLGNERIYGPCSAQQLSFPPPTQVPLAPGITEAMCQLLPHLERGVLLWVAPDGVFIKRFCQGRVYWTGPLAQHKDRSNKLDRERTCKLLDVPIFLKELQSYLQGEAAKPSYEIELCFGEEYPDPSMPKTRKLIIVEVVPLFAVELLQSCLENQAQKAAPEDESNSPNLHGQKTGSP
ncbi:interferon regulatory factor 10 [Aplochiton taeniatus]